MSSILTYVMTPECVEKRVDLKYADLVNADEMNAKLMRMGLNSREYSSEMFTIVCGFENILSRINPLMSSNDVAVRVSIKARLCQNNSPLHDRNTRVDIIEHLAAKHQIMERSSWYNDAAVITTDYVKLDNFIPALFALYEDYVRSLSGSLELLPESVTVHTIEKSELRYHKNSIIVADGMRQKVENYFSDYFLKLEAEEREREAKLEMARHRFASETCHCSDWSIGGFNVNT